MKYLLLLTSIISGVIGQLLLKRGVLLSNLEPNPSAIIRTLLNPYVFAGLTNYGLSAIIWLFVLKKFPLSVAYPALSISSLIIVILSLFFFKEPVTLTKLTGVALIISGVYFIFQ